MSVPTREDIEAAAARIDPYVRRTPTLESGEGVTLKLESLQHAGSFKPRGAFNTVLGQPERPQRLVAASGGNHGLAVAHVGAVLGIPTEVFVPAIASPVKIAAIRDRGATVRVGGENYAAALAASRQRADEPGTLAIHAYDALPTLAGQGTLARELTEQAPGLDVVFVAVGGGGLLGGVAAWYRGTGTRIVAVEPAACPSLHDALAAGRPVPAPVGGLAADSLGASQVGQSGFEAARAAGVTSVLVSEAQISAARHRLWREYRLAVEPAGATAYAAWEQSAGSGELADARCAVIVCGANTDPSDLAKAPGPGEAPAQP